MTNDTHPLTLECVAGPLDGERRPMPIGGHTIPIDDHRGHYAIRERRGRLVLMWHGPVLNAGFPHTT